MIKIPATKAGLPAFSLHCQGINVNVTLISRGNATARWRGYLSVWKRAPKPDYLWREFFVASFFIFTRGFAH
jgi:transaldolase